MSVGKFEPLYYNSKAYSRSSHDIDATEDLEAKGPLRQSYYNGFSTVNEHRDGQNSYSDDSNDALLKKYIHIKVHPNGGASIVHVYDDEIASLSDDDKEKLAQLFFEEVFCEEPEDVAKHVIGIVHGAAKYMPEMVSHLSLIRPDLDIKVRWLGRGGGEGE